MIFRSLALLFAATAMMFAGGLVGGGSVPFPTEDPNPSLIVNNGNRTCKIRISDDTSTPTGLLKFYAPDDTDLKKPLQDGIKAKDNFYLLGPKSSVKMVICPGEKFGGLLVSIFISLDLVKDGTKDSVDDNDKNICRLHFTHGQYNKNILLGMSLTTTYTSLGMETMVSALPALERQAVTIDRKSNERVITKLENYQKSGSGALWELK